MSLIKCDVLFIYWGFMNPRTFFDSSRTSQEPVGLFLHSIIVILLGCGLLQAYTTSPGQHTQSPLNLRLVIIGGPVAPQHGPSTAPEIMIGEFDQIY